MECELPNSQPSETHKSQPITEDNLLHLNHQLCVFIYLFQYNLKLLLTYYFIFRAMDNAAIFKKVFENDGKLESMNDKCTSCILLLRGLICLLENIRSKLWTLNDIDLLEEIVSFTCGIYGLIVKFTSQHSTYVIHTCHKKPGVFYPIIRKHATWKSLVYYVT